MVDCLYIVGYIILDEDIKETMNFSDLQLK